MQNNNEITHILKKSLQIVQIKNEIYSDICTNCQNFDELILTCYEQCVNTENQIKALHL